MCGPGPQPEAIREVDLGRAASDLGYYVDHLREFLGYTAADRERVLTSATLLLPQSRELLDEVYGLLLRFSSTRRFFVGPDGAPNLDFLEKRRKTLFEWLAYTASGALDEKLGDYVVEVARKHVVRGEPGAEVVPLADIEALFGALESVLAARLLAALGERDDRALTMAAWSKLLAAERVLFVRGYLAASAAVAGRG